MNNFKIMVENSAPSQAKPAKSILWACEQLHNEYEKTKIVDFGCGKLRNLQVLRSYFKRVVLVDTKLQCERIIKAKYDLVRSKLLDIETFENETEKYSIIFLICVLHIIPDIDERERIIRLAYSKLEDNGLLVVDVPQGENYYRKKMLPENQYNDGYVFGNGNLKTFYKRFYAKELDNFVMNNFGFQVYTKKYFDKHIVRIYQKRDEDVTAK